MVQVLFNLAYDLLEFRIPELESVASIYNVPIKLTIPPKPYDDAYVFVDVPCIEDAVKIAERMMLVKYVCRYTCRKRA